MDPTQQMGTAPQQMDPQQLMMLKALMQGMGQAPTSNIPGQDGLAQSQDSSLGNQGFQGIGQIPQSDWSMYRAMMQQPPQGGQ